MHRARKLASEVFLDIYNLLCIQCCLLRSVGWTLRRECEPHLPMDLLRQNGGGAALDHNPKSKYHKTSASRIWLVGQFTIYASYKLLIDGFEHFESAVNIDIPTCSCLGTQHQTIRCDSEQEILRRLFATRATKGTADIAPLSKQQRPLSNGAHYPTRQTFLQFRSLAHLHNHWRSCAHLHRNRKLDLVHSFSQAIQGSTSSSGVSLLR